MENIHEKYLSISTSYHEKSVRLNYFLAATEYFSELNCFDHDIALKLRPYGGVFGIDDSSLDKYLELLKILRLDAILNDARGFINEIFNQGPGYFYMLPWKGSNCFRGHLSGILICLYKKILYPSIFHLLEC